MKKQFNTKMKTLTAIGVLSTISLTAIASPILQEVSATLRKDITFTINGEKALEDANTLVYNDNTYVPVRVLVESLGLEVDYTNGNISISEKSATEARNIPTEEIPTTELTPALEGVSIPSATIKAIDETNKQITIVTADQGEIILNVGELDTTGLVEGMEVSVVHSPAMTRSLPPQTAAYEITPVQEGAAELENVTLENVVIAEVNKEENYIVVGQADDASNPNTQTVLRLAEDAQIKHHMNKRFYAIDDLEVGQKITVVHAPIMTLSLPPQTTAFEIILMD